MIKTIRFLLKYLRGYRKYLVLTWLFVALEAFSDIVIPFFMQFMIDAINAFNTPGYISVSGSKYGALVAWVIGLVHQQGGGTYDAFIYGAIMAVFAILGAVFGVLAGWYAASASAGLAKNLRQAMYYHLQDFSFNNIDKFSAGSIVTRITTDTQNVQFAFHMTIRAILRAPLMITFALIMSFFTSWKLALIFVVLIPIVLGILIPLANAVHPLFQSIFQKYDDLNQCVQEDLDGIKTVKAFNRQDVEKKKFSGISDFIYRNFTKAEMVMAFNNPVMQLFIYGSILSISFFGSLIIVNSGGAELSTGGLATLSIYVVQIMNATVLALSFYASIVVSRNSGERIVELLQEKPDLASPGHPLTAVPNGSVAFKDITFHYQNGNDVLHHINLTVKPGETIGIVGPTGSSKSTLMSLIARLYDVSEGSVLVGGHDVREYDLKVLRDSVAVVLQKNTLFTGTIKENLHWGDPNATDDEIRQACLIAQADDFIEKFPDKYGTLLDEGGTNVSGGQKQRICLTRALLKNPKILILDDSTSAVDTHTDALIRASLKTAKPGVTTFIVAERILSVMNCDLILVMDQGSIVARGTSDELMGSSPIYKELYVSQIGGGDFDASK